MLKLDKNKRYNLENLSDEQIEKLENTLNLLTGVYFKHRLYKGGTLYYVNDYKGWDTRSDYNYTCDALELFDEVKVNVISLNPLFGITSDKVVQSVMNDLNERSKIGVDKYGVTLEREDLNLKEWLQHAYEETLDKANYLKRAILELEKVDY